MEPVTSWPVSGFRGIWPLRNTKPFWRTAVEYGPAALGALLAVMISLMVLFCTAHNRWNRCTRGHTRGARQLRNVCNSELLHFPAQLFGDQHRRPGIDERCSADLYGGGTRDEKLGCILSGAYPTQSDNRNPDRGGHFINHTESDRLDGRSRQTGETCPYASGSRLIVQSERDKRIDERHSIGACLLHGSGEWLDTRNVGRKLDE